MLLCLSVRPSSWSLLTIGKHFVRFGNRFEFLFGLSFVRQVLIGMPFQRQTSVPETSRDDATVSTDREENRRFLDFLFAGSSFDFEKFVEIRHRKSETRRKERRMTMSDRLDIENEADAP